MDLTWLEPDRLFLNLLADPKVRVNNIACLMPVSPSQQQGDTIVVPLPEYDWVFDVRSAQQVEEHPISGGTLRIHDASPLEVVKWDSDDNAGHRVTLSGNVHPRATHFKISVDVGVIL